MTPLQFDWDQDINRPVSGRTSRARHASASGAQVAGQRHGKKVKAYLRALLAAGADGLNDFAASQVLACYRTSINSLRSSLMAAQLVEETGEYDVTEFNTKRQRYRLTARGRAFAGGR
jgi:hypothetical protein